MPELSVGGLTVALAVALLCVAQPPSWPVSALAYVGGYLAGSTAELFVRRARR